MDKLLIIIPAYNAGQFIRNTIHSILDQNVNLKLVIVDDASTDDTYNIAKSFPTVIVIRNKVNQGPYYSLNIGLKHMENDMSWTHYAIHGADDISITGRFKKQLASLNKSSDLILAIGCRYNRVDYITKRISSTNPNTNESMLIIKRKVFDVIGYFDNTRAAGDTEYKIRMLYAFPNCIDSVDEILLEAYLHNTNITKSIPIGGTYRRNYVADFQAKHRKMKQNNDFYQSFNP